MFILNLSVLNFMMGLKVLFDLPLSRERIRTWHINCVITISVLWQPFLARQCMTWQSP